MEEIRSSLAAEYVLWKRYHSQKQGILDVLIELNNNIKINIEIQVKASADWDKRQLFYLAKIFTAEANKGKIIPGSSAAWPSVSWILT